MRMSPGIRSGGSIRSAWRWETFLRDLPDMTLSHGFLGGMATPADGFWTIRQGTADWRAPKTSGIGATGTSKTRMEEAGVDGQRIARSPGRYKRS
jgi:hypothetical protein